MANEAYREIMDIASGLILTLNTLTPVSVIVEGGMHTYIKPYTQTTHTQPHAHIQAANTDKLTCREMLASGKISMGPQGSGVTSYDPTHPHTQRTVQLSLNGPKAQPSYTHTRTQWVWLSSQKLTVQRVILFGENGPF